MKIRNVNVDKPAAVFFAIAVVSVGFSLYPLWNYTRFHIALWNFDYNLISMTINKSDPTTILLNANISVMNPTDYTGLEVTSISCGVEYVNPSQKHQVWDPSIPGHWGGGWVESYVWELKVETFSFPSNVPIGANKNVTIPLTFFIKPGMGTNLEQQNVQQFMGFLGFPDQTPPKQIEWYLNCHLILSSFLSSFDVTRYFVYVTPVTW
jgi:hypothetical protein